MKDSLFARIVLLILIFWLLAFTTLMLIAVVLGIPQARAEHGWPQHFSTRTIIVRTELGFGNGVLQNALDYWAPIGVTFELHDVGLKDWCTPGEVTTVADGKIRLCRSEGTPWATVDQVADGHYAAGLVGVHPNYGVDKSYLRYIFCHEVGHTLGLGHDFVNVSCMGHTGWKYPSSHDLETLTQEYAHQD